ncbi:MAG: tyrosine--tRNA ligase, partial [Actinomycetota bacterium]|nr:tyrosine--tRNA ligase [Actinomycetota bacterium]
LQKAYGQRPQVALTMPLLVGTDGVQKMSQSLGNYIGVREPAGEMFGKLMSVPDELLGSYAALAAGLDEDRVGTVSEAVKRGGPDAGEAKRAVARATVALYHGEEAARDAESSFDRLFREHRAPDEVAEAGIPPDAVDGETVYLPRVLAELGLASSRSEARRLISQGGVKVNGEPVLSEESPLADLKGALVQVGKRRFVRLTS